MSTGSESGESLNEGIVSKVGKCPSWSHAHSQSRCASVVSSDNPKNSYFGWSDRDVSWHRWGQSQEYFREPTHAAWKSAKTGAQKWALQALPAEGVWTQARLYAKGLSDHAQCRHCGAVGDQFHRLFVCPGWAALRTQHLSENTRVWALGDGLERFGTALANLRYQRAGMPPQDCVGHMHITHWSDQQDVGSVTTFTNGAVLHPQLKEARRGGWAVAWVRDNGSIAKAVWGPLSM
eukprot:1969745-Amphidinium_carterae.1